MCGHGSSSEAATCPAHAGGCQASVASCRTALQQRCFAASTAAHRAAAAAAAAPEEGAGAAASGAAALPPHIEARLAAQYKRYCELEQAMSQGAVAGGKEPIHIGF